MTNFLKQPNPSFPVSVASQQKEQPKASYEPPAPIGTAYTPVALPRAGKLGSRLAAFQNGGPSGDAAPAFGVGDGNGSGKKLTWSERQAQTKKIQDEEEAASAGAIGGADTSVPKAPSPPTAPAASEGSPPPPVPIGSRPSTSRVPPALPVGVAVGGGAAFGAAQAVRAADADKAANDEEVDRQAEKMDQLKLAGDEAHE